MTAYAVGVAQGGATDTNVVVTATAAVPVGAVVQVAALGNSTLTTLTVTDSRGNTYTQAGTTGSSAAPVCAMGVAQSRLTTAIQVGDTFSVSMSSAARGRQAIAVCAVPDTDATPLDKAQGTFGNSATPSAGATGVLGKATETLLLAVGAAPVGAVSAATAGGFTDVGSIITTVGTNDRRVTMLAKDVTATTTTTPTASIVSSPWVAFLTSFKTTPAVVVPPSGPAVRGVFVGGVEVPAILRGVFVAGSEVPGATVRQIT